MKFTKLLSIAGLFVAGLFAMPETSQAKVYEPQSTMSATACKVRCIPLACEHDPILATKCRKECKIGTVDKCIAAAKKVARTLPSTTCTLGCTAKKCGENSSFAQQCIHSCPEKQVKNCKAAYEASLEEDEDEEGEEEDDEEDEEPEDDE